MQKAGSDPANEKLYRLIMKVNTSPSWSTIPQV